MLVVSKLTIGSDLYHFYLVITALSFIIGNPIARCGNISTTNWSWELETAIIQSLQAN